MRRYAKLAALLAAITLVGCGTQPPGQDDAAIRAAIEATQTAAAFQAAVETGVQATGAAATAGVLEATQSATAFQATVGAAVQGTGAASTPTALTPGSSIEIEGYRIRIAMRGEESLFVVNLSDQPLPLAPLQLGDGPGAVGGTEWGLASLEGGTCVAIWQDSGNPQPPDGMTCSLIGERLTRAGSVRFWKATFNIYYDGALVGTCQISQRECLITIPAED